MQKRQKSAAFSAKNFSQTLYSLWESESRSSHLPTDVNISLDHHPGHQFHSPFHSGCGLPLAGWCKRELQWSSMAPWKFMVWEVVASIVCWASWLLWAETAQNLEFGFGYNSAIIMRISRRNTVCLLFQLTFPCISYLRAFAQAHSRFLSLSMHSGCIFCSDLMSRSWICTLQVLMQQSFHFFVFSVIPTPVPVNVYCTHFF